MRSPASHAFRQALQGPDLEEQLGARGWTLGHYPDSFTHSTLGGWVATRSSGMQSDKYGDISDIARGMRVVMPGKVLKVRPLPHTSTGPSVREMVLGSEGRLGVITEVTVQVHRIPAVRLILGYLFPSWEAGLAAMHDISTSDAHPSITRVSDAKETAFSFATRKKSSRISISSLISKGLMKVLERRGWKLDEVCLSFIGYEGGKAHVARQKAIVKDIVGRHGGIVVGKGPGELYDQKKFDTPYIRDFLLDRGAIGDVSETAAPWSKLMPLYTNVLAAAEKVYAHLGVSGLDHVPSLALVPLGRVPVLHLRLQARRRRPARSVRAAQECDPAGVRGLGWDAVAPPRGRHRACRVVGAGHLRAGGAHDRRAVHRDGSRSELQPGQDHHEVTAS